MTGGTTNGRGAVSGGLDDFGHVCRTHGDAIIFAALREGDSRDLAVVLTSALRALAEPSSSSGPQEQDLEPGPLSIHSAASAFTAECTRLGMDHADGRRLIRHVADAALPFLVEAYRAEPERLAAAVVAMHRHLDTLPEPSRTTLEFEAENRRMQEANRLKSEFLANMSHELRTPLNAIIGFSELMFKGKVGPLSENHREYLGDILISSRHLLQLINDVLDLAKIDSGKIEFRPETVDLAKVVREVRDILRGLASTKRIQVETSIEPEVATVTLDPGKLKQVLYNYLSNGLKFTEDGGKIHIRATAAEGDHFRILVEDTGIGVRPEDLARLFVEFQQLDAGSSKKYAGTGLGLSLTKRIVEAQGGQVGVESELGRGSVFWAVLPRGRPHGR
jgi:signal transduction histidine kinase